MRVKWACGWTTATLSWSSSRAVPQALFSEVRHGPNAALSPARCPAEKASRYVMRWPKLVVGVRMAFTFRHTPAS